MQTWKLNDVLLYNEWISNESKEEIKRYFETNENENKTIQKYVEHWKAILRGKFIALQACLRTNK